MGPTSHLYRIRIANLQVTNARIGVYARERATPQRLVVHTTLALRRGAAVNDVLEETVNYSEVIRIVKESLRDRHINLLETACDTVADALMTTFEPEHITVDIHKPGANPEADVSVGVERGHGAGAGASRST